jgi:hypothetical protein
MAMHVHAFVSTVFIVSLSILGSAAMKGRAFAESACLDQPDRGAPQGVHWYFHLDREKNRKCWHLGPVAAGPVYEAPPPRVERTRTLGSSVEAAFADLFKGIRNLFRRPMQHEAQAGEPRIIQSDATKPLTIEDIAAQPQPELPEDRAEVRPASTGNLTGNLTSAQRKALYEEYLRWEELQRLRGSGASPLVRSP